MLIIRSPDAEMASQVCEDLVKMIKEEARVDSADDPEHDDIFGDGVAGDGGAGDKMDYSKPFKLFDEQGLGIIPVDQFR